MHNATDPGSSWADSGSVMLIGDISRAFLDAGAVGQYPCAVQANILDGIDAAAKGRFKVVGVVMGGVASQLGPALRALRQSTNARIILLARMHEEPIARRLVTKNPDGEKLADAYLICPTQWASFFAQAGIGEITQLQFHPQSAAVVPAEVEQRVRYLERLATTDDLTGLKNRRYTWEFARQILRLAGHSHSRVTLLVFDIDNFKHYNDLYGHPAGDEILREAAVLVRRCCRPHDVVGRIGGDEFAVVFWDDPYRAATDVERDRRLAATEHPSDAIFVAKRFRKEFGNAEFHLLGPGGKGVLTISGGLSSFPRDGSTVEQLFERADLALLEAKRSGKNRIYLVGEPQSDIAEIE